MAGEHAMREPGTTDADGCGQRIAELSRWSRDEGLNLLE
jgi:hypothetical protein